MHMDITVGPHFFQYRYVPKILGENSIYKSNHSFQLVHVIISEIYLPSSLPRRNLVTLVLLSQSQPSI
jgi:hypothetical protein